MEQSRYPAQQIVDEEHERLMAEAAAEELERQLQEDAEREIREAEGRRLQQIAALERLKEEIDEKESQLRAMEHGKTCFLVILS